MKKAIVLSTALLLAGAAAFAADVKFSGAFKAGYNFDFVKFNQDTKEGESKQFGYFTDDGDNNEGEFDLNVADGDGIWNLTFRQDDGNLFGDFNFRTKAVINLGKALAKSGIDLGDVTAKLTFGRYAAETLNNVYMDPDGDHWQRLKTTGAYSTGLEVGYGKLANVQVIFDPTQNASQSHKGKGTYGFAVTSEPVDGVKVAANFSRHGKSTQYSTDSEKIGSYKLNTETGKIEKDTVKTAAVNRVEDYAIGASANVDINKFINVDKLTLVGSGYYNFRRFSAFEGDEDVNKNNFGIAVKAGYDKISGWVEYNYAQDNNDANDDGFGEQWLKALVDLGGLIGVDGLGVDAYYTQRSFEDAWFSIGGDVSYKLGGVTYGLKAEYTKKDLAKDNDTSTFRIRPSVQIAF